MAELRFVTDGPPGPEAGRFVELENERGEGVGIGEWVENDGLWELRVPWVQEWCRRCRDKQDAIADYDERQKFQIKRAEFIVWGKLFPPEALGPRCYDCAYEQIGPHAVAIGSPYAVLRLPIEQTSSPSHQATPSGTPTLEGKVERPARSLPSRAIARRSDPDTSHAAAGSVADLRTSQRAVLGVLQASAGNGLTDEQLCAKYLRAASDLRQAFAVPAQSESGIRTRRRELADAGLVVDTGRKRRMSTGRAAKVWAVR